MISEEKEAIEELKILKEDYWEDDGYGYATAECQKTITALDMAIEALEKQPCEDCISRETVKQLYYKDGYIAFSKICDLPSVTPKEKTVIETLEKIKEEIKQIRIHYGYIDVQGLTIIKVLEIIDRHLSEIKNEIKNGIALPDNITNGDVIKAIFPNLEQDKERLIQQYGSQSLYDTYEKWCSLPYKER